MEEGGSVLAREAGHAGVGRRGAQAREWLSDGRAALQFVIGGSGEG